MGRLGLHGQFGLTAAVLHRPQQVAEECLGLFPALHGGQVIHVRRQAAHKLHAHVLGVLHHITMGCHVIEMLGGGHLAGPFAGDVHMMRLHQLHKAVQLVGRDESIHRVAEQDQLGALKGFLRLGEVLLVQRDQLAHVEGLPVMAGEFQLQVLDGLQRNAVFALGAAVQDEDLHGQCLRIVQIV